MADSISTKPCGRCKVHKPFDAFSKDRTNKDGLNLYCRACELIRQRVYTEANQEKISERNKVRRAANPEKYREQERRRREANPEKYREIQRRHVEKNREEINARGRADYLINRDKRIEAVRRSREKHPEAQKEYGRAYAAANAEKRREYNKLYDQQNPEKRRERERRRRAKKRGAIGSHTAAEVTQMYFDQNGLCAYCEVDLNEYYHVDHMIPLSRGGADSADNLALACQPCNQHKYNSTVEEYWQRIA